MNALAAFLKPTVSNLEKEVVVSQRFVDEAGRPVPFRIKALTQEENEALLKKAKRQKKVNGQIQETHDNVAYSRSLVLAATLSPDFSNRELCEAYGVVDPSLLPGKMLFTGEYAALVQAIQELSGFQDEDLEGEAKNC
ncbi:phage tail assembly chaperone [Acutalibacter intestini]|uniref:phage tail assembly chaperone n=1 Tax=Acutalibacter intestini TaxID=3093659 RepID=UPI002AC8B3E5|nr:phage portal protein [Acutalibacter sp. M00204]